VAWNNKHEKNAYLLQTLWQIRISFNVICREDWVATATHHPLPISRRSSWTWVFPSTWPRRAQCRCHPTHGSHSACKASHGDACSCFRPPSPPCQHSDVYHTTGHNHLAFHPRQWTVSTGHHTTPQPFYGPFSGTTRVSWCQKRTSRLYGAREDWHRQTHRPSGWALLHPD